MALAPVQIPLLGATFGVILVGAILSAMLFGVSNLQSLWYFKQYPNDWWFYRVAVAVIWILDTLDVAISTHALYFLLVETRIVGRFLTMDQLEIIWSCKVCIVIVTLRLVVNFSSTVAYSSWNFFKVAVQVVYAVRLWKVGQHFHKIVPWLVVLITACNAGTGIYLVHGTYEISGFSEVPTIRTPIIVLFSTSTAVDFIIAIAMCYYLNRSRAASMFPKSHHCDAGCADAADLISGLVTSMCSTAVLITFLVWPNTLIFIGIDFMLPRLFINSLLAMLNARKELRKIQGSQFLEPNGDSQLRLKSRCECNGGTEMPIVISMRIESESV
ncbi:uncharacterized protein EV420DRAFT_1644163 [Desarmillaria tabescens]|uniref:DUF6534 domain-containing protein n=1 Tax=Armillaria tabescens TaxID=1929756 RepID=A0AA39N3W6_ARMTA|nr:uncharacterized protein EV420DRAFT_1644163 [Desarmillaria tabescens]KAK0457007.1 hypothetical protein EV420DRAFT_1644163 [Desarmillaria tabescens]